MSTVVREKDSGCQTIADWFRLFSDERFRKSGPVAYADHNFIKEHCRLGFEHFVHNTVDEALLQLYSKAADSATTAIIGAPFTPCAWGTLAVLLHLFRNGNHALKAKRTVYWLTTERGERALFARLRINNRFRRVAEAINYCSCVEDYDDSFPGTSLVMLRGTQDLPSVLPRNTIIVSDGRGELVFRKNEAAELVNALQATGSLGVVIIPSRNLTYALAPEAVRWPWSEGALANAKTPERYDGDAIPWKWEMGAQFAGRTERRILAIDGVKDIEAILAGLKELAYRLIAIPKTFFDARLTMEFQRIIGTFRQMAIPLEDHERGDDERRLSARLKRLDDEADGASLDIRDELKIGLMYVGDLIGKLQESSAKWDAFRHCIDECIERRRPLALAFPQVDPYSAEKTVEYAKAYAAKKGVSLTPTVIADPNELPYFSGELVLLGKPKFAKASRWRVPFRGRATVLTWQFDGILAALAMSESNPSAESVRRATWQKCFTTPIDAYTHSKETAVLLAHESEASEVAIMDGEIEAFDPSYRGGSTRGETILAAALHAKAGYTLTLEDGHVLTALAGEEHHVLVSTYNKNNVKTKTTVDLREGDRLILVNDESYDKLTKRLQLEADRISSLMSFNELWERWQMLCLEHDDNDTVREAFIRRIYEFGCTKIRATVISWLRLQRMGPEKVEDIVCAALAANDFDLVNNAPQLWRGLDQRRTRHRQLGKWLMKALALSAVADTALRDKVIDTNLGLTFGELQRGISVKKIQHIERPEGGTDA
jgi:hypothetical protein